VIFGSDSHASRASRRDVGHNFRHNGHHEWKKKGRRHHRDDADPDRDSERRARQGRRRTHPDWDPSRDRDDVCVDRDRDGRCDVYPTGRNPRAGYPATLPEMIRVILIDQGRRTADQARWLGSGGSVAHYVDADHNGTPERLTWVDAAGSVLQVWVDANRDGRADAVRLYRDGHLYDVVGG
jgi:hypothetical protein